MLQWGACLMAVLLLTACKPKVPKKYIQPKKMERILYDYHLAEGISYVEGDYNNSTVRRAELRKAVFEKYGITEAQFDSSLVYYYRHAERLHDIYANVAKRFDEESTALGSPARGEGQGFANLSSTGDTAVVWNTVPTAVIMPYPPFNVVSFSIDADSAFHKGDKVVLSFNANFIFQEGSRDAVALLSVTFGNDSVATQVLHLYSDTPYTVQIPDSKKEGIKNVRGFIGLMRGQNNDSETLKLMILNQIAVIRIHEKVEEPSDAPPTGAPADTTANGAQRSGHLIDKPVPNMPPTPPRTVQQHIAADQAGKIPRD